jgi:hypothetical protein
MGAAPMMHKQPNGTYVESPIHGWFGLTYSSYFVMPRLALEAQPVDWQKRFIVLMIEAEKAGFKTPSYHVLRDDPNYTRVENYDPEDETSRPFVFTAIDEDPWANYRRGNAAELSKADS